MKYITSDAASAFASIIDTMAIDPTSWSKWRVLHMSFETRYSTFMTKQNYPYVINDIKQKFKEIDAIIYHCDDDNLFVLCRSMTDADMSAMGRDLMQMLLQLYEVHMEIALYHPTEQWRALCDICVEHGYVGVFEDERGADVMNPLFALVKNMEDVFTLNAQQYTSKSMPNKILLVEDDPLTRRIVANCLKDSQQLITASSAEEAITNYMLYIPDIIFLDIGLPDYDGFSVINAIKSHNPDVYIVMFSGKGYADYIARSLQMGARGFVEKPFRKESLFHYINDFSAHHVC